MFCFPKPQTSSLSSMAARASSSNSVLSKQEPPLPKQELKQEPLLPKQEPKLEPQQEVKSEPMDIKEVKREPIEDPIDNTMNSDQQQLEKFKRYEADFKQYLISKYFSDKTLFGGNIYDVKVNANGQTTKASRLPPYQSYLDPATFHELLEKDSARVETNPNVGTSNRKKPAK